MPRNTSSREVVMVGDRAVRISKGDVHPVKGLLVYGDDVAKGDCAHVFGLKGSRGENIVWVSKCTNAVIDVLAENGLDVYETDDVLKSDGKTFREETKAIGFAKNIRQDYTDTEYLDLINDILDAMDIEDEEEEVEDDDSSLTW